MSIASDLDLEPLTVARNTNCLWIGIFSCQQTLLTSALGFLQVQARVGGHTAYAHSCSQLTTYLTFTECALLTAPVHVLFKERWMAVVMLKIPHPRKWPWPEYIIYWERNACPQRTSISIYNYKNMSGWLAVGLSIVYDNTLVLWCEACGYNTLMFQHAIVTKIWFAADFDIIMNGCDHTN